jgi:hypothetical protein
MSDAIEPALQTLSKAHETPLKTASNLCQSAIFQPKQLQTFLFRCKPS